MLVRTTALLALGAMAMLSALGCAQPKRAVMACPPAVQVSQPDPRLVALLARTELALEEATRALAAPRSDVLVQLTQQRLDLLTAMDSLTEQDLALRSRIGRAEKELRKGSLSEQERAQIAESFLDLSAGREVERPVASRVASRDAYKDAVEAFGMLEKNKLVRATLEAQLRGIDTALAKSQSGRPTVEPASARERRPIDPSL